MTYTKNRTGSTFWHDIEISSYYDCCDCGDEQTRFFETMIPFDVMTFRIVIRNPYKIFEYKLIQVGKLHGGSLFTKRP